MLLVLRNWYIQGAMLVVPTHHHERQIILWVLISEHVHIRKQIRALKLGREVGVD